LNSKLIVLSVSNIFLLFKTMSKWTVKWKKTCTTFNNQRIPVVLSATQSSTQHRS